MLDECNSINIRFETLNASSMAIDIPDLNAPCAEFNSSFLKPGQLALLENRLLTSVINDFQHWILTNVETTDVKNINQC